MPPIKIALVGNHSPEITAHRAIPEALRLTAEELSCEIIPTWVEAESVTDADAHLRHYQALWCVPGSPYKSIDGALAAIRWARTHRRPFLGTCGGFQHALIEFARDCAGLPGADHTETSPAAQVPLITMLSCSLVEKSEVITFAPGSLFAHAYGAPAAPEEYRCNYGLNSRYLGDLETAGLEFTARGPGGDIRGAELPAAVHPFFVGALFQPERAALRGEIPPLVRAFVRAAYGA